MMFGFIPRRRHKAEMAALRSQYDALRERCEGAESREATERAARRTITRQFTDADEERTALTIVNACLTEDPAAAREEIAELRAASSDSATTHWRAEAKREKKRADRLQKQYDDAVGMNTARGDKGLTDSEHWKPPIPLDARGAAS